MSTREHSANHAFAECLLGALGKPPHPAIPFDGTVPAVMFAECTTLDTRQIHFFAECHIVTLGKFLTKHFPPPFKLLCLFPHDKIHYILKFRIFFLMFFYIWSISFIKRLFLKKFKVVLHVFGIMCYNEWKIDIQITESNLSHCQRFERKNRISCT